MSAKDSENREKEESFQVLNNHIGNIINTLTQVISGFQIVVSRLQNLKGRLNNSLTPQEVEEIGRELEEKQVALKIIRQGGAPNALEKLREKVEGVKT